MNVTITSLKKKVEELTHSLNFAAGGLSTMRNYEEKHPEQVLDELLAYGKKVYKEEEDA